MVNVGFPSARWFNALINTIRSSPGNLWLIAVSVRFECDVWDMECPTDEGSLQ
jgi:hypothetical protein